jgi:predicted metal-dependent peptidase
MATRKNTCKTCGQKGHNSRTCTSNKTQVPVISREILKTPETPETPETKESFNLNYHTFRLLQDEPFFAAVSRHVTKVATESIPTAGVTVDPKSAQFVLYYNPKFFQPLSDSQRSAVLKHEYYHLILEHCTSRKPVDKSLARLWNFATDLAINSFLPGQLPEGCLYPGKGPFAGYPEMQASEWYFSKLQQDKKFQNGSGSGSGSGGEGAEKDGQFDDHEGWGSGDGSGELDKDGNPVSGTASEVAKERLRDILKKATAEVVARGNQWGSVSEGLRQEIQRRLSNAIDWTKVLRYFVRTSKRSSKVGTIRRVNKRYPYIHPGKKVTRHANIAISIDQSGSVGDEMLAVFFAELNNLSDIAEFTVIPFDSAIAEEKIFVWKKGQKRTWERVLCGGTDFDAPTRYVNKNPKFDGHIILTDLCAPKPGPSKCSRLWITTEACAAQPYFQTNEKIIAIRARSEEK